MYFFFENDDIIKKLMKQKMCLCNMSYLNVAFDLNFLYFIQPLIQDTVEPRYSYTIRSRSLFEL